MMNNKRSFFIGVGFGLVLSAIIITVSIILDFDFDKAQEPASLPSAGQVQPDFKEQEDPEDSGQRDSIHNDQNSAQDSIKEIKIPKGATASDIADQLYAENIIEDREKFLQEVYRQKVSADFIAGSYQLPIGLSEQKVIELMIK